MVTRNLVFVQNAMQELAGDDVALSPTLYDVFANILAGRLPVTDVDIQIDSSFSVLLRIFTYIATPAGSDSARPAGPLSYSQARLDAALASAQQAVDAFDNPQPGYSLSAAASVDEGSGLTVTLNTANLPADTTEVAYQITGISADDTSAALTGVFQLDGAGQATLTVPLLADALTEGTESLTLTLLNVTPAASVTVAVQDTSLTPAVITPAPTGDGNSISADYLPSTNYQYSNVTTTDALLAGSMWGNGVGEGVVLTYSFPTTGASWDASYGQFNEPANGFQALNATHQQGVRDALSLWAAVANITFIEVAESDSQAGDLRFAFSAEVSGETAAWAYLPYGSASDNPANPAGDVWFNPADYNDTDWQKGSDNFFTIVHEVGHGLGLKHSFDTDGNGTVLNGDQESRKYTAMSYSGHPDMGNTYTDLGNGSYSVAAVAPASPLLYDIQAIQYLYGANYNTRTGNDTYSYSESTPFIEAIWDGGGMDTIDASNQTHGVTIKLTAGEFSSIGTRYLDLNVPSAAQDNLAIAFGVEIENAIGSDSGDTLIGNALDNDLTGGDGNDLLYGGDGIDTAIFNGNRDEYLIFTDTGSGLGTEVIGADGADQLAEIEFVQFNDQTVELALLT